MREQKPQLEMSNIHGINCFRSCRKHKTFSRPICRWPDADRPSQMIEILAVLLQPGQVTDNRLHLHIYRPNN